MRIEAESELPARDGKPFVARLNGHSIDAELNGNMRGSRFKNLLQQGLIHISRGEWSWRGLRTFPQNDGIEGNRSNELLAVLSHELRNSLGAIGNAAVVLRMQVSPEPEVTRARLLIERQLKQMSRIVADFQDMSQMGRGPLRLQRTRQDLNAAVTQAVSTVEFATLRRNHRVVVSLAKEPVWLNADAARVEQIFVNLLINAAKYTDDGGEITVCVESTEQEAVVRIRDNGIGIAPKMLPLVFDLFVQADDSSPRAQGGVGIGLALVRGLVATHGGRVSVESAGLGKGSEFTVHLPRA